MATSSRLAEETIDPEEADVITDFISFIKTTSAKRHPTGPVKRFNQGRAAGCVRAQFEVLDALPQPHRVGIFAMRRSYDAWIRFANATSDSDRDKDVRGMAIRLSGVQGENLTPGETRQDFVLNSHAVMVAPNAREFMELMKAMEAGGLEEAGYFLRHPRAAVIGLQSREHPTCHLDIPYFSATPYLFGPGRAVKYSVRPCTRPKISRTHRVTDTYLTDALRTRMAQGDACFDFMIQFQVDPDKTPIEDATVEWKEEDSPFHSVARIRIPQQQLDDPASASLCEEGAFNPWHSLVEHRPLGGMNRARREIYQAMAEFRQQRRTPTRND
jgi:hypothetical protein